MLERRAEGEKPEGLASPGASGSGGITGRTGKQRPAVASPDQRLSPEPEPNGRGQPWWTDGTAPHPRGPDDSHGARRQL